MGLFSKWLKIGKLEDLPKRSCFQHKNKAYAVFKLNEEVFVLDDVCSHEYSRLSEGEVWDHEVYCPKHGSRFDIKTGEVINFPATRPVKTYEVKIDNGEVLLKL
ncbi:MAG: non-heme iron oxygenase ferredoxin subunit [Spirochaetales bacterium]|nr:non-heme iron oxygenase ferredoxin subunit [Spirochaetales bacterium]